MPNDDYTASTGGLLKLKGVNSASKVSKPHKKKRPKPPQPAESLDTALGAAEQVKKEIGDEIVDEKGLSKKDGPEQRENDGVEGKSMGQEDGREGVILRTVGKTETEKRHEERRRKRVCGIATTTSTNFYLFFTILSTGKPSSLSSPMVPTVSSHCLHPLLRPYTSYIALPYQHDISTVSDNLAARRAAQARRHQNA